MGICDSARKAMSTMRVESVTMHCFMLLNRQFLHVYYMGLPACLLFSIILKCVIFYSCYFWAHKWINMYIQKILFLTCKMLKINLFLYLTLTFIYIKACSVVVLIFESVFICTMKIHLLILYKVLKKIF